MTNAKLISCEQLYNCTDEKYNDKNTTFRANPSIAITKKGRIFVSYLTGGRCEPHIENYCVLIYSDDSADTWKKTPALIIPSNRENLIHALDMQLWISQKGSLYVFWAQNNVEIAEKGKRGNYVDGYLFNDKTHALWVTVCENPDAQQLTFSTPRCIGKGILRNKPLVLKNGRWLNCNYTQDSGCYEYSVSDDNGESYLHMSGAERLHTHIIDEPMAYQRKDGSIYMLSKTRLGELAQTVSYDNAQSWSETVLSGIEAPHSRFFISRTPADNIMLVKNDDRDIRCKMTVCLSEDDGKTWKYKKCIDGRGIVACPDADFYGEKAYVVYDYDENDDTVKLNLSARWQLGKKDIMIASFTMEDIKNPDTEIVAQVIK